MRATHTYKRYVYYLLPIILFTVLLFGLVMSLSPAQAAESFSYITADITYDGTPDAMTVLPNTGTEIPSSLVYRGGDAYNYSFKLYRSSDGSDWSACPPELASSFALYYVGEPSAPTAVGSHTIQVRPTEGVAGYKYINGSGDPTAVRAGEPIAEATFSIVPENVSLFVPALDEVASPTRSASLYDSITNGAKVILGGTLLTKDTHYSLSLDRLDTGVFTPTVAIDVSGVYRLNVTFDDAPELTEALSRTCLTREGLDPYVLRREFTVSDPSTELSLNKTSIYVDDTTTEITLSAAPSVSYATAVYKKTNSADTTFYSFVRSEGTHRYSGFAAGQYIYRVTYGADDDAHGMKSGDVVDLSFTVREIPYSVSFRVNGDYDLTSVIVDNSVGGDTVFFLVTSFAITDGSADANVFMNVAEQKYETTYYKYSNGTWGSSMTGVGKYKVRVALKSGIENAVQIGNYSIDPSTILIEKDISVIAGGLRVKPVDDDAVFIFTGSPIEPLKFVTLSNEPIDPVLIDGKYTVKYYNEAGLEASVQAVGHYTFAVTFDDDVDDLNVLAGYVYCGAFDVRYASFGVAYENGTVTALAEDVQGPLPLTKGTDYDLIYYSVSNGDLFHKLGDANVTPQPTEVGTYAAMIVFKVPYVKYNVKASDVAVYHFANNETKATILIDATKLDLTYDGGVKLPPVTFTQAGVAITPVEGVDYSVDYFYKDGGDYVPCGYPVYAGTYKCLVTFLRSDSGQEGVIRAVYEKQVFVIKARSVKVTRKDKNDFVYDGESKDVSVELRVNDRPYAGDHTFAYTLDATPVAEPTNVGTYAATLALDFGADPHATDLVRSYSLSNSAFSLTIKALELEVRYTAPTGYDTMYSGSAFAIDVKYIVKKGKYASDAPISAVALNDASKTLGCPGGYLDISENVTYLLDRSSPDPVLPINPGLYFCCVKAQNSNVALIGASACDQEGAVIADVASLVDGKAYLSFTITPCKVNVEFDLTDDLFYTGEAKGVESVAFKAYNALTGEFDRDLSDLLGFPYLLDVDYYIDYYSYTVIRETGKRTHDGEYHSTTPPTAKGNYIARVVFKDGVAEETKYTIVDGFNEDGDPLDHIREHAYVDKAYSIKQQTDLAAHVSVENVFEDTVFYKIIDLAFIYGGSLFSAGSIVYDTTVTYSGESVSTEVVANGLKVKRSDPGTYTVTFTFQRNTGYHIGECDGVYDGTLDYIAAGDTLVYTYTFIKQKELVTNDWGIDAEVYYDGTAKSVTPVFEAETETDVYSYVGMIKDTHYSIRYYEESGDEYVLMNEKVPTDPGKYIAEIVFLEDLPDYLVNGQVLLADSFTSYATAQEAATLPRFSYEIKQAVLLVSGITVADKTFDGTTDASLQGTIVLNAKEGYGAIVEQPVYTGTLIGHFESKFPDAAPISIVYDKGEGGFFRLTDASAKYYTVEYPALSAKITRARLTVKPKEVRRQYDYSAVDNTIEYIVSPLETIRSLFSVSSESELISGELYRQSGISVGSYDILTDRLSLGAGISYEGKTLSDLLELYVDLYDGNGNLIKYHITKRTVTAKIRSYSKVYGEDDPDAFELDILSGSLVSGDTIVATIARMQGQNVGYYDITASDIAVHNSSDADVSANYVVTIQKGKFTINAKRLVISPPNQTASYLDGFDSKRIGVFDPESNRTVTDLYYTDPQNGDRFIGELSCTPKKAADGTDDPFVYVIGRGTVRMVNAKKEDVSANYDLSFTTEERTFTIAKTTIKVKIDSDAIPSKYYGDSEPIIPFTVTQEGLERLGNGRLTLSPYSSVGREGRRAGQEDAGKYIICKDNSEGTFIVLDKGKDVSRYFDFDVENMAANSKFFEIKPRPIVVAIEDATFENTGMDILPTVSYLNASGDKLSATMLSKLKVTYAAPTEAEFEYRKGDNVVSPIIVGDVTSDPNFAIETKSGTITVVYLQDVITAVALSEEDEIYTSNKNILAGIMLYKPVKFYKLNTANGEQPSETVDIVLPIDKEFKGTGYVAVAMYADGSPKAFALSQDGLNLVYEDDGAYYVAICVVQEWFYAVLGVAAIVIALALFFLIRLLVHIIKKQTAMTPEKAAKKAAKQAAKEEAKRAKAQKQAASSAKPAPAANTASDEVELDLPEETEVPLPAADDPVELPQEEPVSDDDSVELPLETSESESAEEAVDPVTEEAQPDTAEAPSEGAEDQPADGAERTPAQSVFIPAAAMEDPAAEEAPAEMTKEEKKALREQEKAAQKERERAEKERARAEKERIKREQEEERARREMEKKAKKANSGSTVGRPMAFIPTGAMTQPSSEEDDTKKKPVASTADTTEGDEIELELPTSDDASSSDDLVLSRSSSMFTDEEDDKPTDGEDDNG